MTATTLPAVSTTMASRQYEGFSTLFQAAYFTCVAIFIGVIWAAFDAQKQGWHDKIAGTYVVKA